MQVLNSLHHKDYVSVLFCNYEWTLKCVNRFLQKASVQAVIQIFLMIDGHM